MLETEPQTTLPRSDYRGYVNAVKTLFGTNNPENYMGKPYMDWTVADFRRLDDNNLGGFSTLINSNREEIWELIPTSIRAGNTEPEARAEFNRVILREMARRGIQMNEMENVLRSYIANESGQAFRTVTANQEMQVTRPVFTFDQPANPNRPTATARLQPEEVYAYDLAQAYAQRLVGARVSMDVLDSLEHENNMTFTHSFTLDRATDQTSYNHGYAVGSDPNFNPGQPLEIKFDLPNGIAGFENIAAQIFDPNAANLSHNDAFILGAVQARLDRRESFEGTSTDLYTLPPVPANDNPNAGRIRTTTAQR